MSDVKVEHRMGRVFLFSDNLEAMRSRIEEFVDGGRYRVLLPLGTSSSPRMPMYRAVLGEVVPQLKAVS